MRLLASVQHYLATVGAGADTADTADTLTIQQYAGARVAGAGLEVELDTDYPWSGEITVRVLDAPAQARGLALRIPSWSSSTASFALNDSSERSVTSPDGYLLLRRQWQAGDEVRLRLDLTPRWTVPDRRVDAVRGCAAIERGPLVYCFEQADQAVALEELAVAAGAALTERAATVDGVGPTVQVVADGRPVPLPAIAIPYFQWDNRGPGAMRVWIPGE
jgi:DUF1680 family protein